MTLRDYLGRRQYPRREPPPPILRSSPPPPPKPQAWDAPGPCAWCGAPRAVRPYRLSVRLCGVCREHWRALANGRAPHRLQYIRFVSPSLGKRVTAKSLGDILDEGPDIRPYLGGRRALRGGLGP
jgi:hypothetical protein